METKQAKEYIVLYFDMLGFRGNILQPLKDANGVVDDRIMSNIIKYSAAAHVFLENARKLYRSFVEDREATLSRILPGISCDKGICNQKFHMGLQQFSDTSMIYIEDVGVISWMIAQQMLMQMSEHIFDLMQYDMYLRGCLTVGSGWVIEENCLFGQVVEDCYNAEQNQAGYQRIIVTTEFKKRLKEVFGNLDDCGRKYWSSLFAEDYDGQLVFDYIETYKTVRQIDVEAKIKQQLSAVERKLHEYKEEGKYDLAEKYYHCADYLRRACK